MNKKPWLIGVLFMISASSISHADILGVADTELILNSLKQLSQLRDQYRLLSDTYQSAQNQLDSMNRLKDMHSGHYGFGDLSNGLDELQSWQSPVSTWDDALKNLSGGNQSRYKELVDAYEKNHPNISDESVSRYMTPNDISRFKEDKAVNRAVHVQTTEAYNVINKHIESLHNLSKQIEKTPNTKSAVDLNSRLLAEIGFIQLMSLRLQTLVGQQLSQDSLAELNDRAEMARFNRLQDK